MQKTIFNIFLWIYLFNIFVVVASTPIHDQWWISERYVRYIQNDTHEICTRYARNCCTLYVHNFISSWSITVIYIEINQQYIKQNTRNYQTLCVKLTMQSSNGWIYLKLYTTLKIIWKQTIVLYSQLRLTKSLPTISNFEYSVFSWRKSLLFLNAIKFL